MELPWSLEVDLGRRATIQLRLSPTTRKCDSESPETARAQSSPLIFALDWAPLEGTGKDSLTSFEDEPGTEPVQP